MFAAKNEALPAIDNEKTRTIPATDIYQHLLGETFFEDKKSEFICQILCQLWIHCEGRARPDPSSLVSLETGQEDIQDGDSIEFIWFKRTVVKRRLDIGIAEEQMLKDVRYPQLAGC